MTSTSNSPDNPAVLVQLVDKAQVLSEGWVFQKYPGFNTYQSETLQLQLMSATADCDWDGAPLPLTNEKSRSTTYRLFFLDTRLVKINYPSRFASAISSFGNTTHR